MFINSVSVSYTSRCAAYIRYPHSSTTSTSAGTTRSHMHSNIHHIGSPTWAHLEIVPLAAGTGQLHHCISNPHTRPVTREIPTQRTVDIRRSHRATLTRCSLRHRRRAIRPPQKGNLLCSHEHTSSACALHRDTARLPIGRERSEFKCQREPILLFATKHR